MTKPVQIFAVGGGGFTHPEDGWPEDSILEDRLLDLAGPKSRLQIGYIGHASNDNPVRINAFHARFRDCAGTKVLSLNADRAAADTFLTDLDILYVGGGTTTAMLAHWRNTGIGDAIVAAAKRGLILGGVSAGAICWFSELLLGTAKDGYDLHAGLGLLAGSACPHFSNEPERRQAFELQVANGHLAPGIAIDDGVGVHFSDGVVIEIVRARGGAANAYSVTRHQSGVEINPLHPGHCMSMTSSDAGV